MKILVVSKFPPLQGGMSVRALGLTEELARRGHQITVVTDALAALPHERIERPLEDLVARLPAAVRLVFSEASGDAYRHHPMARPAASQLASLALREIERDKPNVIYAAYLEPYVVAAAMASSLTGIPLVATHAGSDVTRLMSSRDLQHLYSALLRQLTLLSNPGQIAQLCPAGVDPRRVFMQPVPLPSWADLAARPSTRAPADGPREVLVLGKMSNARAVSQLLELTKQTGAALRLVGCPPWPDARAAQRLETTLGAAPHVRRQGYVWPWEVPDILARATVLSCLEEGPTEIATHLSGLPLEGFAAGVAVACSERLARMYGIPLDACITTMDQLAEVLSSGPDAAADIAARGHAWLRERHAQRTDIATFRGYVDVVEQVLQNPTATGDGTKAVAAFSRYLSSPRDADGDALLAEDRLWAGRPADAVYSSRCACADVLHQRLARRVALRVGRMAKGRYHVLAQLAGLGKREWIMSRTSLDLLAAAEGATGEAILDAVGASSRDLACKALTKLRRWGLLVCLHGPALHEPIPPLVEVTPDGRLNPYLPRGESAAGEGEPGMHERRG